MGPPAVWKVATKGPPPVLARAADRRRSVARSTGLSMKKVVVMRAAEARAAGARAAEARAAEARAAEARVAKARVAEVWMAMAQRAEAAMAAVAAVAVVVAAHPKTQTLRRSQTRRSQSRRSRAPRRPRGTARELKVEALKVEAAKAAPSVDTPDRPGELGVRLWVFLVGWMAEEGTGETVARQEKGSSMGRAVAQPCREIGVVAQPCREIGAVAMESAMREVRWRGQQQLAAWATSRAVAGRKVAVRVAAVRE